MTSRPKPPRPADSDARGDARDGDRNGDRPVDRHDEPWGTIIELCFGVRDWWGALCEELDLTPSQGMALRTLDRPLPMSMLADALACDASNITGIVDKLESRGLIARRGSDHDRRIKLLCVTERGRSLRDRLIRRLLEPPATLAALSHDAKGRLTATLRNLIGELTRTREAAASAPRPRPLRAARG